MRLFELQDRPQLDKEFDRNIMPQIRKNNLEDGGFKFEKKKIKLSKLKPVQSQRVQGMHDRAMRGFKDGSIRPIIIDKNNYIVNGHHRYDVARGLDMDKVKVLKVNATVEELIDYYKHTASDEPTIEEQLKAKLQQKLNEIKLEPDLYKNTEPKDNSYITDTYKDAVSNSMKYGRLPGITNSEMYDNGHTISIFLVENKEPIFLLNIQRLADGWSTVNVVAHSQHRGKAFSIPLFLAVSKHFGKPLYSFGSQSVAGNRIWEKLYQQYPNRIKAVDVTTQKELDVDKVFNDDNFKTRLKLLPDSIQEEDVTQLKPQTKGTKAPLFSKANIQKAYNEWAQGAAVDTDIEIVGKDNKLYVIRQNYDGDSQHFEEGEWYLTDANNQIVDTEGYPDPGQLLYDHQSDAEYYPTDPNDINENFAMPPTNDKLLQKIRDWRITGFHGDRPSSTGIQAGDSELFSMCDNYLLDPDKPMSGKLEVIQKLNLAMDIDSSETPTEKDVYDYIRGTGVDMPFTEERNLNPAVADYVKGKKTKLIKVKVADLDDEAIDDRFGRVIDPDPDVGVDLDNPILLDKDGKTILDGFHRVYQAKRIGREFIPAEIIDENFKDGKKKGKSRPGRVKRAGASCKGSVTSLRKKAKNSSGEKSKMYHWCANMKSGRKKS